MADPGLLAGIGAGLQGAVGGFATSQELQRRALENKQRQQALGFQQQAEMLGHGLEKDENGNLRLNANAQKEQEVKGLMAQNAIDESDKDSSRSANKRAFIKGLMNSASQGSGDTNVPDTMSGSELDENKTLLGDVLKGTYGMQGRQMTSDRVGQSNDIKRDNLNERKNQNAVHAGLAFENDPIMKQTKQTTNSLNRALSIANGNTPVTSQNFNMLQQDLINAVAPGGAATEGKVNRELVDTLAGKLNELNTKFGNIQDLRKEQPQVFGQLVSLIKQVKSDYGQAQQERAQDLADAFKYSTNSRLQNTVNDKKSRYLQNDPANSSDQGLLNKATGATGGGNSGPTGNAGLSAQDQQAITWASANKSDPRAQKILQLHGMQ